MVGAKAKIPLTIENSKEDEAGIKGELYIYSKELGIDSEMGIGSNSDHSPFERIGIDSVTLIHKDIANPGYHTNLDTADATINKKRILSIQRLILYYIEKEAY